ncbi:peroxisomal biogenesis factor 11ab isoform X2 [Osmia lignaria lignaria]|uniref:peroxisomal biogenesis factor 11ab isoform X2 n=1 Tax=Osmia lignaria lignaria TaxID=1437193 RepID=UPI0014782E9A|nr:peroxisomal membrane protein 11 homolog isoform X2 [Osmia lignaria]
MDIVLKLNEQTVGRDKIIRLLQYGSRAYWYYAQNTRSTQHSAEVLRSLEYTFSSFRKLLRLGRCLDSLYSALKITSFGLVVWDS